MVVTICKEFNFAMAHMLENHEGLCKNIHGHNYQMFVIITGEHIEDNKGKSNEGMVCDFKELKEIVNKNIIDDLDHSFAYNGNDKLSCKLVNAIKKVLPEQKFFKFNNRVTAELMAEIIRIRLNDFLPGNLRCSKIVLYETPTSYAVSEE